MFTYPLNGAEILKKKRAFKLKLLSDGSFRIKKRIAVLGGSTVSEIVNILELFLLDNGIEPVFYVSEYNQYWHDAMSAPYKLKVFKPDIIFIHTTNRNVQRYPLPSSTPDELEGLISEQYGHFSVMWEKLRERFKCPIIQNNFELPSFRLYGNKDFSDPRGRVNFINRLNVLFADYADANNDFYINDINYISACYGLDKWSDPLYWNMYKYALALPAVPEFAFNISNIIKSVFGKNKKAMAIDLDNTLWGGVIGDDGLSGIEIGQETPIGQAYVEFQQYIKLHKDLGVILNICSKNEIENALEGLSHPNGVLNKDDFLLIKANWEPKSRNILDIAGEMGIFPDGIVFVDDNPVERELVNVNLPTIVTPEMNGVENYIRVLDRGGYFETTVSSDDDKNRYEMYRRNIDRQKIAAGFTDYGDYLKNLEMRAVIDDFDSIDLQRITQLTNKSNQFNLTTRRYTLSEIESLCGSASHIRLCGRLIDKFGDNGIVSVIIGEITENNVNIEISGGNPPLSPRSEAGELCSASLRLNIDLWLMSCRVLKRDMEFAMLDRLCDVCKSRGIKQIRGFYYPSGKNGMVSALYEEFGFALICAGPNGSMEWELVLDNYEPKNKYIEITKTCIQ